MIDLRHGDSLAVLREMEPGSVDAIVTDPPYGLAFMGKRWDYDVPGVDLWRECFRVLKDGGRLLCFAGTRTMHRMWCNIEDAGFTIEDSIAWMYGSGFPKHRSKLKPAYEPVCVARKGAVSLLNIDACRIGTEVRTNRGMSSLGVMHDDEWKPREVESTVSGRWPANVLLDEVAAAALDEQSGERKGPGGFCDTEKPLGGHAWNTMPKRSGSQYPGETGGASRFFYVAKASKRERGEGNTHPTVKPVALMEHLVRLVTPPGGVVLDPFMGSGTTGVACVREGFRFVGIEREAEYLEIARGRIEAEQPALTEAA